MVKYSGTELLQNVGLKFGNEARLHMLVDIFINIICGKVFQLREAPFTDVSAIADLIIICMILSLTDVEDEQLGPVDLPHSPHRPNFVILCLEPCVQMCSSSSSGMSKQGRPSTDEMSLPHSTKKTSLVNRIWVISFKSDGLLLYPTSPTHYPRQVFLSPTAGYRW